MRKITLNKMRIENFKGIQNLEIAFNGENTLIAGYNGTGKSTIADAYFWATTGKNAALNTKFEVRPRDKQGNEVHGVITSVECEFAVADENSTITFTIKRDELEDLTKKEQAILKAETIAPKKSYYFIDNAPYSKKLFDDKLAELLCPGEVFTLLSNPLAFFMLDESKQRVLLTAACGDVQNADIDGYDEVKAICGAVNTPEQTKDTLSKSVKATQKRLDEIPARIDSISKLCDEYADYYKQIAELQAKQDEIKSDGESLKAQRDELMKQRQQNFVAPPRNEKALDLEIAINRANSDISELEKKIAFKLSEQEKTLCPNCGFMLLDNSVLVMQMHAELLVTQNRVKGLTEELAKANAEYEKACAEYEQYKAEQSDEGETFNKIKNIMAAIDEKRDEYANLTVEIGKITTAQKLQSEIKALRAEQCTLDEQLAADMTKLDKLTAFILKKAEKVVDNINKRFSAVQFKLFEMQTNGELKTCCKAMKDGVSYANINTASKVQVGIELAKLFAEFYGVTSPLWVDDKESVIDLPAIEAQTICLKVDEQYKELKIINS